jgi:four helix bundle protein
MGEKIRDYRDLKVWQKAMDLVILCYTVTRHFPRSEVHGLTSQLRRAGVSVASNIAEGNGRASTGAYIKHLSIANGSLMELETKVRIAGRLSNLKAVDEDAVLAVSRDVGRMLATLKARLRYRQRTQPFGSWFPVPGSS